MVDEVAVVRGLGGVRVDMAQRFLGVTIIARFVCCQRLGRTPSDKSEPSDVLRCCV